MSDELHCTMEKKLPTRQSPCANKNNGVISEKKSDYVSNKNGRQKKSRDSNNGTRLQDPIQQPPKPTQKYNRGFGDKRPRQRGYSDNRQSEEIAEPYGLDIDIPTSRKGKGNANYLLNFSFQDHRGYQGSYSGRGAVGSWGNRKTYRHHIPSYKKEQYLQSSLQFVVHEAGDYSLQGMNPDALVDWDTVHLVRTFSTQIITCPICLDVPIAAKLTKCGHTYCWACILHYLHVNDSTKKDGKCPVCNDKIDADSLKSVQNMLMPEYKIGDEIEMRLMRKSKGSVFVCPEDEWTGKTAKHLNIDAGERTKFSKLLTASWSQIQKQVIEREKDALSRGLVDAESEEVCFLQMAQQLLQDCETNLKKKEKQFRQKPETEDLTNISKVTTIEAESKEENLPLGVSFDGTKITTQYSDAFDEEEGSIQEENVGLHGFDEASILSEEEEDLEEETDIEEKESEIKERKESSRVLIDSSVLDSLTPEEAADQLELPDSTGRKASCQLRKGSKPKDTYHFYQASTGQQIYMNSVNARCFDMEYGGLENSPKTVTATVVAVERIFMTEETRKRLRYLNHIPLTTEFHVVELKIKPPVISKETLKHFQPEFDKRRKIRQKKAKEEKIRANKHEIEHKKLHGVYVAPETQIPLDNTTDFPAPLASSPEALEKHRKESTNSDIFESGASHASDGQSSPVFGSPRIGDATETTPSFASFAQKLQSSGCPGAWGASSGTPKWSPMSHSVTMPEMRGGQVWGRREQQEDPGEEEGEAYHAPSMTSSWLSSLHDLPKLQSPAFINKSEEPSGGNGKKKKKKSKNSGQLLFSTSMTRKT